MARRRQYDGEKIRLCGLHKIELIEVLPEDLGPVRFRQRLKGKLPLLPVQDPGHLHREMMGIFNHIQRYMNKNHK